MNELTANTRTLEIFPWNENFCTGIEEIDVQHKRLVELLNVLVSHLAFNADTPTLNNVFDEKYYERSYSALWVAPGAPRNLTVNLTLDL